VDTRRCRYSISSFWPAPREAPAGLARSRRSLIPPPAVFPADRVFVVLAPSILIRGPPVIRPLRYRVARSPACAPHARAEQTHGSRSGSGCVRSPASGYPGSPLIPQQGWKTGLYGPAGCSRYCVAHSGQTRYSPYQHGSGEKNAAGRRVMHGTHACARLYRPFLSPACRCHSFASLFSLQPDGGSLLARPAFRTAS
jgi:hypothetical protein